MRRTDDAAVGVDRLTAQWTLLLQPEGAPGALNMAIDQSLLDDAAGSGAATLRLYRWAPSCLSFGRNEAATLQYDRTRIAQLGIDAVRRPTGGSVVWHEHEVTYAVAAPIDAFGSLRDAYLAIHQQIAAALRSLGTDVTLAPGRRLTRPPLHQTAASSDRPGPCFASSVGGEILVRGRKLVGSAQVRKRGAFLQHGSILLDGTQEMIAAVSYQPSDVSGAATLADVLGRGVSFHEVADAVVAAFSDRLTAASSPDYARPPAAPFLDPAWTWRR